MTRTLLIAVAAGLISTHAAAQDSPAAPNQPTSPSASGRGGFMMRDQTRQEAQQRAASMFQRLDTNRDGALTREEARMASQQMSSGGARVERLMARLFGDAQSLTQAQFEAQALARFDRNDLNHDGVLTLDERRQGRAAARGD